MGEQDALLAVTTLSFDIAALEIFLPLIVGGRVELIDRDVAADGARLAGRLDDPGITFLQATPATWRLLLEAGWQGKPTLTMLCGGEALPRALADRLLDKGAALWNLYGPTETTVWSSAWRVEAGETPISIGRPIANTRLYVLDKRLRAVPVGVIGELYIGGAGLARGYRDRPGLTAERFLPDPFGDSPGGRLYRTGDLARWRPDGTLECLGRVDHQVKIRGFRVELGEIEAALARHPAVREAVVAARPDATGEMSLAAYVVPRDGPDPITAGRAATMARGPRSRVHGSLGVRDPGGLPLTPNGKVDRQALPDPARGAGSPSACTSSCHPEGPIEAGAGRDLGRACSAVSRSVLTTISSSEAATRSWPSSSWLASARCSMSTHLSRDFLEEPTVSRLGEHRRAGLGGRRGSPGSSTYAVRRDGSLPASFAQQRLWFLDQLEPGRASYNIPAAVRLEGPLDVPALGQALSEVVRRHEVLRTTLVSDGGNPAPGHRRAARIAPEPWRT